MLPKLLRALGGLTVIICAMAPGAAFAACTLPNNITNGQIADASQVMGNFNALTTCMSSAGTISAGTAGQVGYYNSSGNTISGESVSSLLDNSFSSTQGSIIYRGSSGWQALAPGGAHSVLSTNGAGADPSWVPQSGGGSGGKFGAFPNGSSAWSVSGAAAMNVVQIVNPISVSDLGCLIPTTTGATYKMGIAGWDPVNHRVTSVPVYTTPQTVGTGTSAVPLFFSFSTPVAVTAGSYAVMLIRTDGAPTTSLGVTYGSGYFWAPQLYITGSNTVYYLASQAPTTSDTWSSSGGGTWTFSMMYTY